MPVRNGEAYLREALLSLQSQSFEDWELILVDDGSTDGTAQIFASFGDRRFTLIANSGANGIVNALNLGLASCRGDYIARMDADDICLPHRFSLQCAALDRDTKLGLVCGNVRAIDARGRLVSERWWHPLSPPLEWSLLWTNPIAHPTVMARRSALETGYPAGYAEDYRLWIDIAASWKMKRLNSVILHYRMHAGSEMAINREEHGKAAAEACRLYARRFAGDDVCEYHVALGDFSGAQETNRPSFSEAENWLKALTQIRNRPRGIVELAAIVDDCRRRLHRVGGMGIAGRLRALGAILSFPPAMVASWLMLAPALLLVQILRVVGIRRKRHPLTLVHT